MKPIKIGTLFDYSFWLYVHDSRSGHIEIIRDPEGHFVKGYRYGFFRTIDDAMGRCINYAHEKALDQRVAQMTADRFAREYKLGT